MQVYADLQRSKHLKIGFVPTMGALHDGHLSLIEASKKENDLTICSVFVNPTQFNEASDFDKYPRQVEADVMKLKEVNCDAVFIPGVKDIYPTADTTIYKLGPIAEKIEGAHRPGHFNGVASVVKRLFEAVKPHRAYFGLKDYQQYLVVKELTKRYELDVEIVGCPIKRENSGLAMSSRNQLLTPQEAEIATGLYKSLKLVKKAVNQYTPSELEKIGLKYLSSKNGINPEYFLVVDKDTLEPTGKAPQNLIALVAARVGTVRLIDNLFL